MWEQKRILTSIELDDTDTLNRSWMWSLGQILRRNHFGLVDIEVVGWMVAEEAVN